MTEKLVKLDPVPYRDNYLSNGRLSYTNRFSYIFYMRYKKLPSLLQIIGNFDAITVSKIEQHLLGEVRHISYSSH